MADAQADVLGERADSHNRHLELWGQDKYWRCNFVKVSPEDAHKAKKKWGKYLECRVNGRARTIKELFGDSRSKHVPAHKQEEYKMHQMMMNKTGETCRYIKLAFGKNHDTNSKKRPNQRFRALGYFLCGMHTQGIEWMSHLDKEYAQCALLLIQNIHFYDRPVNKLDRLVENNNDTLYNTTANGLEPDSALKIGVYFNPEFNTETYEKIMKSGKNRKAMMTRIDNMLLGQCQRQHRDAYMKSRLPLKDQPIKKPVNGTGTVL